MCVGNPRNADFDDLPFYGDQGIITRWRRYCTNCDVVESLNNC